MRTIILTTVILAATQAACHSEYELYVQNAGNESIVVTVEIQKGGYGSRDDDDVFIVSANSAILEEYRSPNLDVLITRNSDGLILFADDFDKKDFKDDHGKIEITVQP